jgi:hypothetical protein
LDEREREIIIKEARLAALHDLEAVLRDLRAGKLIKGGLSDETRGAVDILMFYLAQRIGDVAQDKADRQRLSHTPWTTNQEDRSG